MEEGEKGGQGVGKRRHGGKTGKWEWGKVLMHMHVQSTKATN